MKDSFFGKLEEKLIKLYPDMPKKFIYVDVTLQQMFVIEDKKPIKTYPISTSRFGTGSKEGSEKTPLGIHRIKEKIGAGAPIGRVFKDRKETAQIWKEGELTKENLILTRILRLEGMEEGINKGEGIDTYERYIYIHGTNHESLIGTPFTHGCICMKNKDIIELFDEVTEGTIVFIS